MSDKVAESFENLRAKVAGEVLSGLERQAFADWYETDFIDYVEGAEDARSKEEILEDIKRIFRI